MIEHLKYPLTIGCDPEFFLTDVNTKKPISPHSFIQGTKEKPLALQGGSVQVDGLALEIGINPAATPGIFTRNIKEVLEQTRQLIPKDYNFNYSPAVFFDKEYYDKSVPPEAKVLGCTPDRDAYKNGAFNPCPTVYSDKRGVMRTGAGHLHFGWGKDFDVLEPSHIYDCILLVKNLDTIFENLSKLWDKDTERRKMYGKPGCFRVKPYGCEYRSLSNAWLENPKLYPFIFDLAVLGFVATQEQVDLSTHTLHNPYGQRTPSLQIIENSSKSWGRYKEYRRAYLFSKSASIDGYKTNVYLPDNPLV